MAATTTTRPASLADAEVKFRPTYAKPSRRDWKWRVIAHDLVLGTCTLVHPSTSTQTQAPAHFLTVQRSGREMRTLADW